MQSNDNVRPALTNFSLILSTIIFISIFIVPITQAALPDYIFFSIEGDTTGTTMTQGDEFGWGSNCDMGATVNWEIWFDINSNSTIEPEIDFLLSSESITDGNLLTEADHPADGWSLSEKFNLLGEPGGYIFKATDIETDVTVQKVATIIAMPSPPNQFTGQITIPGITAPNSFLANRFVTAESDSGDEGVLLALTDDMGAFTMNIGANGTGVEFYIEPTNVPGFVTPTWSAATASGLVANNDFTYITPTDSVWGFVKDELGVLIPYETDVSAREEWPGEKERDGTTKNSRYVIYFTDAEVGIWEVESASRTSPTFLSPYSYAFNLDAQSSLQHDLILTRTNAEIFVKITENGGLPTSNYLVNAQSSALSGRAEAVTGTGSDNVVGIGVSTMDNSGWEVFLNIWDDDFPIPNGFIASNGGWVSDVAPGVTVTFNLITGHMVSGTITQDPSDAPIVWDELSVYAGSWRTTVETGGSYTLYTADGSYFLSVNADGYISTPSAREITVTGDTSGVGLNFELNETHCRVSGILTGVPLPLNASFYGIYAYTGSGGINGYQVYAEVDSVTGTYSFNLSDGDWAIVPPYLGIDPHPDNKILTIAESPDTVRTVDFDYESSEACCGFYVAGQTGNTDCDINGKRNLGDITKLIDRVFLTKTELCCEANGDVNTDTKLNLADITTLIDHVFLTKVETAACM